MRNVKFIAIHCTASQPNATKESILNYWKNVLKWKSVGYHRLIDANGIIHELANYEQTTNGVYRDWESKKAKTELKTFSL